jgi:hypothetical protein
MPNAEEEAKWRAGFEQLGEGEVHDRLYHGSGISPTKRVCAPSGGCARRKLPAPSEK